MHRQAPSSVGGELQTLVGQQLDPWTNLPLVQGDGKQIRVIQEDGHLLELGDERELGDMSAGLGHVPSPAVKQKAKSDDRMRRWQGFCDPGSPSLRLRWTPFES